MIPPVRAGSRHDRSGGLPVSGEEGGLPGVSTMTIWRRSRRGALSRSPMASGWPRRRPTTIRPSFRWGGSSTLVRHGHFATPPDAPGRSLEGRAGEEREAHRGGRNPGGGLLSCVGSSPGSTRFGSGGTSPARCPRRRRSGSSTSPTTVPVEREVRAWRPPASGPTGRPTTGMLRRPESRPRPTRLLPSRRAWTSPILDGQLYGEPLVADGRVVAATENDTVYVMAADSGQILWSRHLATAVPSRDLPCGDISPEVGITGTPVIDLARHEIFVDADTLDNRPVLLWWRGGVAPPLRARPVHRQGRAGRAGHAERRRGPAGAAAAAWLGARRRLRRHRLRSERRRLSRSQRSCPRLCRRDPGDGRTAPLFPDRQRPRSGRGVDGRQLAGRRPAGERLRGERRRLRPRRRPALRRQRRGARAVADHAPRVDLLPQGLAEAQRRRPRPRDRGPRARGRLRVPGRQDGHRLPAASGTSRRRGGRGRVAFDVQRRPRRRTGRRWARSSTCPARTA